MVLCEPYLTNPDENLLPLPWVKWATNPSVPRMYRRRSCAPTPWLAAAGGAGVSIHTA